VAARDTWLLTDVRTLTAGAHAPDARTGLLDRAPRTHVTDLGAAEPGGSAQTEGR
jgi:hypothetical protein